jgi:hypothetical protein
MKFVERSAGKRVDEMPLRSTGNEDEERKVVLSEEEGNGVEDFALNSRIIAFVEAVDDDKPLGR